jgi:tetratricopeptide (TPR) repeat protein
MIASIREDYDQALGWYRKSLAVAENLGDRTEVATCYHQFGIIASKLGNYNQAIDWYGQSLGIFEELDDRFHIAMNYMQLGNVYARTGQAARSMSYTSQSLSILLELSIIVPSQNMNWLPSQREALGDARFRQILAEYLDPENIAAIVADLDALSRMAAE